jgi:hypothetical protein
MQQPQYSIIRLESWRDYFSCVSDFSENWAFRGQANATWVLNTAIERTEFIAHHKDVEAEFVAEFQRGARNYLNKDEIPEHLIEWLALMQHHGAPTRLLDLTKSPFTAAYFAYELAIENTDYEIAIWGINIQHLKSCAIQLLSQDFEEALQQNKNLINEKLFEKIFYENNRSLVFPVEPFRMNKRYSLQQSIFISTGTSKEPFMQQLSFLGEALERSVVKIVLPSSHKKEALRDLQKMNLHRASLFPDLDGYALSLRLRYDSMKSPEDLKHELESKQRNKDYRFIP